MKIKNVLLMGLSLVLVAVIAIGGTVAYLTDTDSDVNVMTLGNVSIAQHEYERVQNADGTYEMVTSAKYGEGYKLQPFTQGKPLYPATGEITGWGAKVPLDQIKGATGAQAVLAGLNNVQDKFVLVENTGKTDAYVRTMIALEYGSNVKDIIGLTTGDFWTWNGIGIINVDGNNYYMYEAIYKGADSRHVGGVLPAGEYTYNSLGQVYLASEATNEDCEALDGNNNGTYDILVFSQAVQADGFADATTALDAAFGDITTTNHPWSDGVTFVKEETLNKNQSGTYGFTGTSTSDNGETYIFDNVVYDGPFFTQGVGSNTTIEGAGVTFEDEFEFNGGYIAEEGTFTLKNINVNGNIVITAGKQDIVIENCSAESIQVYAGSASKITISNCTVNGVGTTYSGNNKYGVYIVGGNNIEVNVVNSKFTNIPGHVISVQGSAGTYDFNISGNTFDEYGLAYTDDRAAFKIWGDAVYAPNETDPLNTAAMELGKEIIANNTFHIDNNEVYTQFYGNSYNGN